MIPHNIRMDSAPLWGAGPRCGHDADHSAGPRAGSILELLIAVPTYVVARYRDYCCGGFITFVGLAMGAAVMLFAYGPAVFYLFAERWKRLHPNPRHTK